MRRLLLALLMTSGGLAGASSCNQPASLEPAPGLPEYQAPLLVPVPGARVNVAGNNLLLRRTDLSIDTRIGRHAVGATYNSAGGGWLWTFQVTYDGITLVDDSGAVLPVAGVAAGEAIPGTHWVVLDAHRVKTKGGLVHEFGPDGSLAAVYWSSDPYPRIETRSAEVAGASRITRLNQCREPGRCDGVFDIEYDAAGRVSAVDDRAGRKARFDWDAEGRLVRARDALDIDRHWDGFRYEYTGDLLSAVTNSEGERVEYEAAGDVLEVTSVGEGDPVWSFRRMPKASGKYRTHLTDPLGNTTVFTYDFDRRVQRIENPLGEAAQYGWQGRRAVAWTRADGTSYAWAIAGDDVVAEIQPSGNIVQIDYAASAVNRAAPLSRPILRVQDSLGLREERSYDAAGRLLAATNGAGESVTFTHGSLGELLSVTRPDGSALGFDDYGEHGHPESLVVDGEKYPRFYDGVGNLLERAAVEPDAPGVHSRLYDADRNVSGVLVSSQVGEYGGAMVPLEIARRSDHRVAGISRLGADAEYDYDALGRLVERRDRMNGVWSATRFEWDALGRLAAVERANGAREERIYDAAGRLVARSYGRGQPLAPESSMAAIYADGRVVALLDGVHAGAETWAYDAAGRAQRVEYPDGESLSFGWDLRSRLVSVRLEDPAFAFSAELEASYDGAGREDRVSLDGMPLLERTLSDGRLAEMRYGNGLTTAFQHLGALEGASETVDAQGAVVARRSLADVSGGGAVLCVEQTTETFGALPAQIEETTCLGTAPSRRISSSSEAQGGSHSWDYFGSPISKGSWQFLYGPDGVLLEEIRDGASEVVHAYLHDEAGFASERDGEAVAWDAAGRATGVGDDHALSWDGLGRAVAESHPTGTTRWRFGGLVEVDGDGRPVALDLREVRIDLEQGSHRYRHFDARGNVAFVTDAAGEARSAYRYGAFGAAAVYGADDDPVRFALGREFAGMVLLGHRLLDPAAGRFLAPDPIYQLTNQYTYALGDSLLFWDQSGLEGTFHGATAGEWAVAATAAAGATGLLAWLIAPGSIVPAVAVAAAAIFAVIDARGGFPWQGDRTVADLLKATSESPDAGPSGGVSAAGVWGAQVGGLDFAPMPVAGVPHLVGFDQEFEGNSPTLDLPGGGSIAICAPVGRPLGGMRWPLVALVCVNLILGLVLAWRARSPGRS